jgi:hypothetical protein
MNDIIAKIYGAGGGRPARPRQASNPDWSAGASGDTVGGIGNTAGMGEDITWGKPVTSGTSVGQVVNTPAGKYKVVQTDDGFGLEPMEGALRGVSPTLTNFASGEHHLGINPETGEVWYQQATSIPSNFSQGADPIIGDSQPPSGGYTMAGAGGVNLDGSEAPQRPTNGAKRSGMPTNNYTPAAIRGLDVSSGYLPDMIQPTRPTNADYVKMVNEVMINSLFKDMI